jgi:hypothetical protein
MTSVFRPSEDVVTRILAGDQERSQSIVRAGCCESAARLTPTCMATAVLAHRSARSGTILVCGE